MMLYAISLFLQQVGSYWVHWKAPNNITDDILNLIAYDESQGQKSRSQYMVVKVLCFFS